MNEGYPKNWKHCIIHLNPETGEMHSDGDHTVREYIEQKILVSRVELPVMPNEVLDGGLTEEEQEFMEMIINWQMENPKAYERIKAFADISISRATLFSALADYASQREA